jgi:hypothetical protein
MTLQEEYELFALEIFINSPDGEMHKDEVAEKHVQQYGYHINQFNFDSVYQDYLLYFHIGNGIHSGMYRINPNGKKRYEYLNSKKLAEDLANRKLKADAINAERISKTYWLTFALAVGDF